jgi:DNA-binding PadR family transcriptional regulator
MARKRNTSPETIAILRELINNPDDWLHGYELSQMLNRARGPVYRTLNRLENEKLLDSKLDETWVRGPVRKLYCPTLDGIKLYQRHLAALYKTKY